MGLKILFTPSDNNLAGAFQSMVTIAKMADVEEQDIDRLLANPPEKVEIEVKYKIAVTVMELRFWLKDCELPV